MKINSARSPPAVRAYRSRGGQLGGSSTDSQSAVRDFVLCGLSKRDNDLLNVGHRHYVTAPAHERHLARHPRASLVKRGIDGCFLAHSERCRGRSLKGGGGKVLEPILEISNAFCRKLL